MSLNALLNRDEPSWWELFRKRPYKTLAQSIYDYRKSHTPAEALEDTALKIVCISDTHNKQPIIPPGQLLIHAGDLTQSGSLEELQSAIDWLDSLPHQHKVVIAGNHDLILDGSTRTGAEFPSSVRWGSVTYLESESIVLHFPGGKKLSIYGNPMTRKHGSWCFQYDSKEDVFSNVIPEDTDILVTHSPPSYHLDLGGLGDFNLLQEVWRVRPKLHVFGHIHAGYGQETLFFDAFQKSYEEVCHRSGGFTALLHMVFRLIVERTLGMNRNGRTTIMVNAATVGGARDNILREPLTVHL